MRRNNINYIRKKKTNGVSRNGSSMSIDFSLVSYPEPEAPPTVLRVLRVCMLGGILNANFCRGGNNDSAESGESCMKW